MKDPLKNANPPPWVSKPLVKRPKSYWVGFGLGLASLLLLLYPMFKLSDLSGSSYEGSHSVWLNASGGCILSSLVLMVIGVVFAIVPSGRKFAQGLLIGCVISLFLGIGTCFSTF